MKHDYVHGYTEPETARLNDQANTLSSLLHYDSVFPEGSKILETGCGVGAQTEILCRKNPSIRLTSIDISGESLELARKRCMASEIFNSFVLIYSSWFDIPSLPKIFVTSMM